jgi:hypothetical protein
MSWVQHHLLVARLRRPYLSFKGHDLLKQVHKTLFQLNFMAVTLVGEISVWSLCLSHNASEE